MRVGGGTIRRGRCAVRIVLVFVGEVMPRAGDIAHGCPRNLGIQQSLSAARSRARHDKHGIERRVSLT